MRCLLSAAPRQAVAGNVDSFDPAGAKTNLHVPTGQAIGGLARPSAFARRRPPRRRSDDTKRRPADELRTLLHVVLTAGSAGRCGTCEIRIADIPRSVRLGPAGLRRATTARSRVLHTEVRAGRAD